jgi:DNA-binding response OmpR family regulator
VSNVRKGSIEEVSPSIVLLEDYPALATAIASALKKFAPAHATHTARSLKELEALATELRPELLLIDVDPPWPKLTQLLGKLRSSHPGTRALVLGATIPAEISQHVGKQRALQFLQKPFDVAELGAAVQALLGPWANAEREELRGTLRCFNAIDAALLQCASGRSVVLEVVKKNGAKSGELHFVDGQLRHAENGRRSGVEALEELFSWKEADIKEKDKIARTSSKRTIPAPWTEAFVLALQGAGVEEPQPPPAKAKAEAKAGKRIVVIDDTDMLLLFVEDVLSTADPGLRISTAPTGAAGVKTVTEILPDLVLLDYSLPDFNGDEVCRRLLADERTAKIPILMMSGHTLEMNRTAEEMENVVATIEKPFLSEALVTLVRQTLESPPAIMRKKRPPTKTVPQPLVEARASSPSAVPVVASAPASPSRSQRSSAPPEKAVPRPEPTAAPKIEPVVQRAAAAQPPPPASSQPIAVPPAAPAPVATPTQPPVQSQPAQPAAPPPPPAPAAAPPPPQPAPPSPAPAPPAVSPPPPQPVGPPRPVAKPPTPPAMPIEHPVPQLVEVPSPLFRPQTQIPVIARPLAAPAVAVPVLGEKPNEIVLGLFLEVVSLQLTPTLRMGMLRARPSSLTVSLQVGSAALKAALPPTGFQLGAVDLDRHGRIAALRVKPTVQPFTPLPTRNSLQIGAVALVPHNSHENLQLTPTPNGPMRMQLIAILETAGVELSNNFQIANIVLKNRHNRVRVTLSEQAVTAEKTGTICEISSVQIDGGAHIVELTLSPV